MTDRFQRRSKKQEPEGIILDKKFRIMPLDDRNIELQELITYKDKNEEQQTKWDTKGYYSTIPGAIKSYCRIRTIRAKNMEELLFILENLNNKIDNQFQVHLNG